MTTQTEALTLALEALKPRAGMPEPEYESLVNCAITAIKEALAQPEQEPVRIMGFNCVCGRRMEVSAEQGVIPAPQRKPLTLGQLREHWQVAKVLDMTDAEIDFADYVLITRDVEALHGIKE